MKKITIKDFMKAIKFQLGEGYEYGWKCHGPNAYGIGWEGKKASAGIVYDTKSGDVYSMEVWDDENNRIYRWISPKNLREIKNEYEKRGLDFQLASDKTKYEDLSPRKIISKLKALCKRT